MEISLLARGVGIANQGKGAALHVTVGRVAAVVPPIFMEAIAKPFGLAMSFYMIGSAILAVIAFMAVRTSTSPVDNTSS